MTENDPTEPQDDDFERAAGQIEAPLTSLVGDYEEAHGGSASSPARDRTRNLGCLDHESHRRGLAAQNNQPIVIEPPTAACA